MTEPLVSVLYGLLAVAAGISLAVSHVRMRRQWRQERDEALERWYRHRLAERDHMCCVGEQLYREGIWSVRLEDMPSRWAYAQLVSYEVYGNGSSNYTHIFLPRLFPLAWTDEAGVQHVVAVLRHPQIEPPPAMLVYVLVCQPDTRVMQPKADAFATCLACVAKRDAVD